jgi:hypothetical protein
MNEAIKKELRQLVADVAIRHRISTRVQERMETFAYELYENGVNVSEVARLLDLAAGLFELNTLVVRY